MSRRTTDPYEVLGLRRGATEADVRSAYLRLAKKHHPDKNPGDKASEWIFKEVQRAYETLRDAKERESQSPPPGDRAERDQQRERAGRVRQRQQQWERTEREEYKRREQQARAKHSAHGNSGPRPGWGPWWEQHPRAKHSTDENSRPMPTSGSVGGWLNWALGVVFGTLIFGLFLVPGLLVLLWLWRFLGLPVANVFLVIPFELAVVVALPVAFGLALLVFGRPKV